MAPLRWNTRFARPVHRYRSATIQVPVRHPWQTHGALLRLKTLIFVHLSPVGTIQVDERVAKSRLAFPTADLKVRLHFCRHDAATPSIPLCSNVRSREEPYSQSRLLQSALGRQNPCHLLRYLFSLSFMFLPVCDKVDSRAHAGACTLRKAFSALYYSRHRIRH